MHAPYASGHLNRYFWAKNGANAHFRTICTYFSRKNYKNIAASAPMRELGHARTLRIGALKSIFLGQKMVQMHILGPYAPISVDKIIKISLQVLRCANLAMHAPYASGHLNRYFWAKNGSNAHFRTICTYFSRKKY